LCRSIIENITQGKTRYTIASIREKTPSGLALIALESINKKLKLSNAIALEAMESLNRSLKVSNANLVNLSMTDPLTELLNRRASKAARIE
jgi:hypothetical protein